MEHEVYSSYFQVFGCVCCVFIPNHLCSKINKKVVRCVFIGYDSQQKGWRCCNSITEKCYTSWNVVFDESSSNWSTKKEILLNLEGFKDELQFARIQLCLSEDAVDDTKTQGPWQTGVYKGKSSETAAQIPFRKSRRMKSISKYVNVVILEDANAKEPKTFAEAQTRIKL